MRSASVTRRATSASYALWLCFAYLIVAGDSAHAGIVCDKSPLPQFTTTVAAVPSTVHPCDSVVFDFHAYTTVDGEVKSGDWDSCVPHSGPAAYSPDYSLAWSIKDSDGREVGTTWSATGPGTYTFTIKAYNDPASQNFDSEGVDTPVTKTVTVTVQDQNPPTAISLNFPSASKFAYGDSTHYAQIYCSASVTPTCLADKIRWSADTPGAPIVVQWWKKQPDNSFIRVTDPTGSQIYLRYVNLPKYNYQFPNHWVKASVGPNTSAVKPINLFFNALGTDHPGPAPPTGLWPPNWYYYWSQTSANYGSHDYTGVLNENGWGETEFPEGYVHIGKNAYLTATGQALTPYAGYSWSGIDLFAVVCRHEAQHSDDYREWWPYGYDPQYDVDLGVGDLIRDAEENVSIGPWVFYPTTTKSNPGPQYDDEVFTQAEQLVSKPWTIKSANNEDWSVGGKQW